MPTNMPIEARSALEALHKIFEIAYDTHIAKDVTIRQYITRTLYLQMLRTGFSELVSTYDIKETEKICISYEEQWNTGSGPITSHNTADAINATKILTTIDDKRVSTMELVIVRAIGMGNDEPTVIRIPSTKVLQCIHEIDINKEAGIVTNMISNSSYIPQRDERANLINYLCNFLVSMVVYKEEDQHDYIFKVIYNIPDMVHSSLSGHIHNISGMEEVYRRYEGLVATEFSSVYYPANSEEDRVAMKTKLIKGMKFMLEDLVKERTPENIEIAKRQIQSIREARPQISGLSDDALQAINDMEKMLLDYLGDDAPPAESIADPKSSILNPMIDEASPNPSSQVAHEIQPGEGNSTVHVFTGNSPEDIKKAISQSLGIPADQIRIPDEIKRMFNGNDADCDDDEAYGYCPGDDETYEEEYDLPSKKVIHNNMRAAIGCFTDKKSRYGMMPCISRNMEAPECRICIVNPKFCEIVKTDFINYLEKVKDRRKQTASEATIARTNTSLDYLNELMHDKKVDYVRWGFIEDDDQLKQILTESIKGYTHYDTETGKIYKGICKRTIIPEASIIYSYLGNVMTPDIPTHDYRIKSSYDRFVSRVLRQRIDTGIIVHKIVKYAVDGRKHVPGTKTTTIVISIIAMF